VLAAAALHVDTIETFQTEDGTRVTSRWLLTGTNNGILGTEPNGKPVAMTGTAVWTVNDERLQRGRVEQASSSSTTTCSRNSG
jgi:predicted ester cyclase